MTKLSSNFFLFTFIFSMFWVIQTHAQIGTVEVNQDKDIDALLRLKKDVNKTLLNYKIQIYSGNREDAKKARLDFRKSFANWTTDMKFETPNYKIWIGNFKTRLEADRALVEVKRKFNYAFIFKPKKKGS